MATSSPLVIRFLVVGVTTMGAAATLVLAGTTGVARAQTGSLEGGPGPGFPLDWLQLPRSVGDDEPGALDHFGTGSHAVDPSVLDPLGTGSGVADAGADVFSPGSLGQGVPGSVAGAQPGRAPAEAGSLDAGTRDTAAKDRDRDRDAAMSAAGEAGSLGMMLDAGPARTEDPARAALLLPGLSAGEDLPPLPPDPEPPA